MVVVIVATVFVVAATVAVSGVCPSGECFCRQAWALLYVRTSSDRFARHAHTFRYRAPEEPADPRTGSKGRGLLQTGVSQSARSCSLALH
eukprot:5514747-Pyramimonas_sp.AAC.1